MSIPNASDVSDIKPLLEEGEQVLWAERPERWAYAKSAGMVWISLLGLVFMIGGLAALSQIASGDGQSTSSRSGNFFGLDGTWFIGGLLTLVGALMVFSPIHRWLESGKVIQFITDRRVAVVNTSKRPPKFIGQWGVEPLKFLEVRHKGGGVGSLLVGHDPRVKNAENAMKYGLFGVRDVDRVHKLIGDQRYAPGKDPSWLDQPANPRAKTVAAVDTHSVPKEIREVLQEGEEVVWHGRPLPGPYANHYLPMLLGSAVAMLAFGGWMSWGLLTSFLGNSLGGDGRGVLQTVVHFTIVLPFALVSVGPIIATLVIRQVRFRQASQVQYAITRRRGLVINPAKKKPELRVREFNVGTAATIKVKDKGTWGSIVLGSMGDSEKSKIPLDNGFIAIESPRRVAELLKAQSWASGATWR